MLQVKTLIKNAQIYDISNKNNTPDISIIMPTYCRGNSTLKRSINSVLKQSYKNFEFIIVDDGSKDETFNILKNFQKKDSRIIIIRHENNCSLPAVRVNEGVMYAKGKYICYQFDDDEYLPNFLEDLHTEIIKHDTPCVVYGNCKALVKISKDKIVERILGSKFDYSALMNNNQIANNSVMHHKSVFEKSGMYDPHILLRRLCDYDLWLRMAKLVPFIWVNKLVSIVHGGEKYSLGIDVNQDLIKLSTMRKHLEVDRNHLLMKNTIFDYHVDGLNDTFQKQFTLRDIDYLKRFVIIPFLAKHCYYLSKKEKFLLTLSRPFKKNILVTKGRYSTSIDIAIKNFTNRIKDFPYSYYFMCECLQPFLNDEDFDILILYKTIENISTKLLKHCQEIQKPVLYFMDDNLFTFHELGHSFRYLNPEQPKYKELEKQVSKSNMIVSYNSIITESCKKYTDNIIELKTNVLSDNITNTNIPKNNNIIRFIIMSGDIRKNIISSLWKVFEDISYKYKDKIEFHFWGINPNAFKKLNCKVYYIPFTHSYEKYIDKLKENYFDYQICPLEDNIKTLQSKSIIKLLEGTISNSVGIFSNVYPYSTIPKNLCMLTSNSISKWKETLEIAINQSIEKKLDMLINSKDYIISNYSTESQIYNFLSAIEGANLHLLLQDKKIAYFIHDVYLGGATIHLIKHALLMRELGFKIIICAQYGRAHIKDLENYIKKYKLEIKYIKFNRYIKIVKPTEEDIGHIKDICNFITDFNIGLIHSVTYIPSVGIACKKSKIPHVSTLHQFYGNETTNEYILNNKLINAIHSSSNLYAKLWSDNLHVYSKKMCCPVDDIFYNYYEKNKLLTFSKYTKIKILISGTLQERKNQLNAIKAINILRDKGYKISLTILGYNTLLKNYYNQCNEEIINNHLEKYIKILGFSLTPEEYYTNHDILLCASTNESTPQSILQAMAAGVLVVSTNVGGIPEIINNNYSGIICEDATPSGLAEGIERIILFNDFNKFKIKENAHNIMNILAKPNYIRSELIDLYNQAFENYENK